MESTSDNDHQHCKQWPINISWQVVKCEKGNVGAGQGFEDVFMCAHPHVRVGQTEREAGTWGETVLQSSRERGEEDISLGMMWWANMLPLKTNVPRGLEFRHASALCFLSICLFLIPLRWVFYLRSVLSDHLQKWGPGITEGEKFIYASSCVLMKILIQCRKLQEWKLLTKIRHYRLSLKLLVPDKKIKKVKCIQSLFPSPSQSVLNETQLERSWGV